MIISATGKIHGRGSDRWKWVSGLTAEERAACRRGELVLIHDTNPHPACTPYKQVLYKHGRYYHRNYQGEI